MASASTIVTESVWKNTRTEVRVQYPEFQDRAKGRTLKVIITHQEATFAYDVTQHFPGHLNNETKEGQLRRIEDTALNILSLSRGGLMLIADWKRTYCNFRDADLFYLSAQAVWFCNNAFALRDSTLQKLFPNLARFPSTDENA